MFEVRATPIDRGRYAGEVLLAARWRRAGEADWRRLRSLDRRAVSGDAAALAALFRDVEAAAQNAPAR
jgi:hypothetical protein